MFKFKQIGQKVSNFSNKMGSKIYGGVRTLGQKVYDNRYKVLGTAALAGTAVAAVAAGEAANALSNAPRIAETLRGKFSGPGIVEQVRQMNAYQAQNPIGNSRYGISAPKSFSRMEDLD